MQENVFFTLVSLKLSGEATPAELEQLQQQLFKQPELSLQLERLEKLWNEKQHESAVNRDDAFNKHLQRLSNHLAQPVLQYEKEETGENEQQIPALKKPVSFRPIWLTVAAAACITSFFLLFYQFGLRGKNRYPVAQNTVSTKPGSKSKVQLPDGTQVWLNADSKLTYDENFQGKYREVFLTGEAYFDVVKNKEHPFIIHTKTIDIKVLGTAFNVRSYSNEEVTETALIRGVVEVTPHNNPDKKIILKPYEKLILRNKDSLFNNALTNNKTAAGNNETLMVLEKVYVSPKDSSTTETSWTKNTLAFEAEPLGNVALKLERWYDVKIIITDEKLKKVKYTGAYTNEPLSDVLNSLKLTGNFKYNLKGKEVYINP